MPKQASDAQVEYLSGLFVDCGFTLVERKAWLENRFHRDIVFLDQLYAYEAHKAISELVELRERRA